MESIKMTELFIEKEEEGEQGIITTSKKENTEIRKVHPLDPRAYILIAPMKDKDGNLEFKVNVTMLPEFIYKEIMKRMADTNKLIEEGISEGDTSLSAANRIAEAAFGDGGIFKNGEIVLPDRMEDIEEYQGPKKKFDIMYG